MRLFVIGDNNMITCKTNLKYLVTIDNVLCMNTEILLLLLECDFLMIQADSNDIINRTISIGDILLHLDCILHKYDVHKLIVITFALQNMESIMTIYDNSENINNMQLIFISSIHNEIGDRWIIEISNDEYKESIKNLIYSLHYDIEIDHRNILFLSKGALNIIFDYLNDVMLVKKKYQSRYGKIMNNLFTINIF